LKKIMITNYSDQSQTLNAAAFRSLSGHGPLRLALTAMTWTFLAFGLFCSSAHATDITPRDWSSDTDIDGGTININNVMETTVPAGGGVYCAIDGASDYDTFVEYWVGNPDPQVGFDFDTLTYSWDDGGAGGTFNSPNSATTNWTAPQTPGTYTLKCTIDDTPTPIVAPETGNRDDTAVTKEITVKVVAVKSIQYRLNGEGDFAEVSETLKVPVGQMVEFKALIDEEGSQWPMGAPFWGGTSGATGGGETTTVTFYTQSSTATDFKTVTATCGNTITANVIAYTLSFQARRKGSEDGYSTSATVAAGAKTSDEHMGELLVQSAPAISGIPVGVVTIKGGGLGGTSAVTAQASLDGSTTDGSGQIKGSFTSGNRTQATEVELDANPAPLVPSHPTVSFNQVWNEISNAAAWDYEPYFEYDEASPLTYTMAFDGDVPITMHDMDFETLGIGGLEWDPNAGEDWDEDTFPDGDYVDATYSVDDLDTTKFDLRSALVSYDSVLESPSGTYGTEQTVASNGDFVTDYVEFRIVDTQTYDSNGQ
jgi:hypothetical protein